MCNHVTGCNPAGPITSPNAIRQGPIVGVLLGRVLTAYNTLSARLWNAEKFLNFFFKGKFLRVLKVQFLKWKQELRQNLSIFEDALDTTSYHVALSQIRGRTGSREIWTNWIENYQTRVERTSRNYLKRMDQKQRLKHWNSD